MLIFKLMEMDSGNQEMNSGYLGWSLYTWGCTLGTFRWTLGTLRWTLGTCDGPYVLEMDYLHWRSVLEMGTWEMNSGHLTWG